MVFTTHWDEASVFCCAMIQSMELISGWGIIPLVVREITGLKLMS